MSQRIQTTGRLTPVATALAMAVGLAVAAAKPAGAQGNERPASETERSETYFTQCLLDWDAETHMTRQQWSYACRRVARERGDPESEHAVGSAR
jgi:hypothetical protein